MYQRTRHTDTNLIDDHTESVTVGLPRRSIIRHPKFHWGEKFRAHPPIGTTGGKWCQRILWEKGGDSVNGCLRMSHGGEPKVGNTGPIGLVNEDIRLKIGGRRLSGAKTWELRTPLRSP